MATSHSRTVRSALPDRASRPSPLKAAEVTTSSCPAKAPRHLPVGSVLECLTPHCDPTVNLYDVYHVVHGDTLVDIWPIDARGAI